MSPRRSGTMSSHDPAVHLVEAVAAGRRCLAVLAHASPLPGRDGPGPAPGLVPIVAVPRRCLGPQRPSNSAISTDADPGVRHRGGPPRRCRRAQAAAGNVTGAENFFFFFFPAGACAVAGAARAAAGRTLPRGRIVVLRGHLRASITACRRSSTSCRRPTAHLSATSIAVLARPRFSAFAVFSAQQHRGPKLRRGGGPDGRAAVATAACCCEEKRTVQMRCKARGFAGSRSRKDERENEERWYKRRRTEHAGLLIGGPP